MADIMFPTHLHRAAVEVAKNFFFGQQHVDTILLVNSLARGKASIDSDIDICVLVTEATNKEEVIMLENIWNNILSTDATLNQYKNSHPFAQIHLDIIDGAFKTASWENGGGIDFFEVEIGNRLRYSAPLIIEGKYFQKLKLSWLPYYDMALQSERLTLAKENCMYDLDHIPFLIKRGLHFHAFDKLYLAFQKFLQTLFIKHQTYPVAYNKWIKQQIVEILRLPDLYKDFSKIISVNDIESKEVGNKAKTLKKLLDNYC